MWWCSYLHWQNIWIYFIYIYTFVLYLYTYNPFCQNIGATRNANTVSYINIYIRIYIYIYMYIYIYIYLCIYIDKYIYTYWCLDMWFYICSFLLFVWLFLFTYILLAVVYVSHWLRIDFLTPLICNLSTYISATTGGCIDVYGWV
jgi:hypothetical protein